jgi:hypothetical protein
MSAINTCVGIIYQKGKIKGFLHDVKVIISRSPVISYIFPQPLDICKEVSGVMFEEKKLKIEKRITIKFISVEGEILEGDFYINPYIKVDNRTFFDLEGALIRTK